MENWNTLVQGSLHEDVPPVLVRVVSQRGSAPRTAGARMLVRQYDIAGTVGGGQYEALAIETARALQKAYAAASAGAGEPGYNISTKTDSGQASSVLAENPVLTDTGQKRPIRGGVIRFSLAGVEDMDMVCGGELCLLLEVLDPDSLVGEIAAAAVKAETEYKDFCLISFFAPLEEDTRSQPVDEFLEGLPQGTFVPLWVDTAFCLPNTNEIVGTNYPQLFQGVAKTAGVLQEPGFIGAEQEEAAMPALDEIAADGSPASFPYCFADPFPAPPVVHIFGGGHVSKALADCLAPLFLGVVVLEDRAEFITKERFPQARTVLLPSLEQNVIREYLEHVAPEPHHGIVIMTRGHAYDRETLAAALDCKAGYIGMIGSKRKWVEVQRALLAEGVSEAALRRVCTPIGLSIGAETPEEIAVSIAAEIIAWRRGAEVQK